MIPVKQIVFTQAEGLHADCRAHTCTSWSAVEQLVQRLALTAPVDSCYKCDVFITWTDGREAIFRFELQRANATQSCPVADEIRDELQFLSGRVHSPMLTDAQHEAILRTYEECNPKLRERAARLLDGYDIGAVVS